MGERWQVVRRAVLVCGGYVFQRAGKRKNGGNQKRASGRGEGFMPFFCSLKKKNGKRERGTRTNCFIGRSSCNHIPIRRETTRKNLFLLRGRNSHLKKKQKAQQQKGWINNWMIRKPSRIGQDGCLPSEHRSKRRSGLPAHSFVSPFG